MIGFHNEKDRAKATSSVSRRAMKVGLYSRNPTVQAGPPRVVGKKEIDEKSYYDTTIIGNYEDEVRIGLVELDDVNDIIQQKINALKGEE